MNKKRKGLIWFGTLVATCVPIMVVMSCGETEGTDTITQQETNATANKTEEENENYYNDFLAGNAWYTGSAEMRAMALTEYNAAKLMFEDLTTSQTDILDINNVTSGKVENPDTNKSIPVVWMDLDETVLNNYPYENYNLINEQAYSSDTWNLWVEAAAAPAIPGSIDFINYVWEHGGVVIYNSSREQFQHKDATKQNLINLGVKEEYLPDWVFWMQGVDENTIEPWNNMKDDDGDGYRDKSSKEDRANVLNTNSYDLSSEYILSDGTTKITSGDNVTFKTIMRVGDNLNDFNDNATSKELNDERISVLVEHIAANFGSTTEPGKIYDADADKWTDETWNEGYVLIGGNSAYGGWIEGLIEGNPYPSEEELRQGMLDALQTIPVWDGTSTWDGA